MPHGFCSQGQTQIYRYGQFSWLGSIAITQRPCDITDKLFKVTHDVHEPFSVGHKSPFIEVLIRLQRVIPPITAAHTSMRSVHIYIFKSCMAAVCALGQAHRPAAVLQNGYMSNVTFH